MKLEKYRKRDNKKIGILIFTICCILLVAGVFLYTSYAWYEENEDFNLINGTVEDPGDLYFAIYVDDVLTTSMPTNDSGYTLDTEKSSCNNGVTISWDKANWAAVANFTNYAEQNSSRTKCTLYFKEASAYDDCVSEYGSDNPQCSILANLDTSGACPTVNDDGSVKVTGAESTNGYLCSAKDDYGTSYYYRGNVTNNYVKFAGFYWRIIRVNGDGSIRMIYAGDASVIDALDETTKQTVMANGYDDSSTLYTQIGTSAYNSNYGNNAYVGYMYGSNIWGEAVKSDTTSSKEMNNTGYYYATSYTFDTSTGKYTLGSDAVSGAWSSAFVGYYTCKSTSSTGTCTTMYKINSYVDNAYGSSYSYTRSGSSGSYTEVQGTTLSNIVFGTEYYYGTGFEVYESTGGFKLTNYSRETWDESKVGYYTCASTSTSCTTLYYVESYDDAVNGTVTTYTGWTGTTYAETHANINNSTIKTKIDSWYETNLKGTEYESYLSDTLFCNDRSISTTTPSGYLNTGIGKDKTAYRWYYSPSTNYPRLTCQEQNDRFTVNDTSLGNGALTYPIGLITSDEANLAGGYHSINSGYYLYTGYKYWALSPTHYEGEFADVDGVSSSGVGYSSNRVFSKGGVRPVLNLSTGLLKKGTGVWNDPYTL